MIYFKFIFCCVHFYVSYTELTEDVFSSCICLWIFSQFYQLVRESPTIIANLSISSFIYGSLCCSVASVVSDSLRPYGL